MKTYNKLVRDRIPEIIEKSGKKANYRVLSDDEFKQALKDKLLEEVNELLAAETKETMIEEIADIYTVMREIKNAFDIPFAKLNDFYINKDYEKGEFKNKYFLESVED